jgi:hypothetical protein
MYEKIQNSFSGGIISPDLWHRTDLPKVQNGLKQCENAIITTTGNWRMRPGSKYLNTTNSNASHPSILIPFVISDSEKYLVEIVGGTYNQGNTHTGIVRIMDDDCVVPLIDIDLVNEWSPIGHANRIFTGVHQPFEIVKSGNGWKIYGASNADNNITIHSNYGNTFTVSDIAVSTNSSDTLSVTYESSKVTIKFANATPSKNAANLVEAAIQALGTVGGNDVGHWWVVPSALWESSPPITGHTKSGQTYTKALYKLNSDTSDYLAGIYVVSDGGEIKEWCRYLDADLPNIKWVQDKNKLYMVDGRNIPQVLEFIDSSTWHMYDFEFEEPPYVETSEFGIDIRYFDVSETQLRIYNPKNLDLLDSYVKFSYSVPEYIVTLNIPQSTDAWSEVFSTNGTISWNATFSAPLPVGLELYKSEDGINFDYVKSIRDTDIGSYSNGKQTFYKFYEYTPLGGTIDITITISAYTHSAYGQIGAVTYEDAVYLPYEYTKIVDFNTKYNVEGDELIGDLFLTNSTNYINSLCDLFGWPAVVYVWQNRLGFASTTTFPYTRWESKTGLFTDFGVSSPIIATDSLSIDIHNGTPNDIHNIVAYRDLIILTNDSEWSVNADAGGYGPLNIPITHKESANGSATITPIMIDNTIIYCGADNDRLRTLKLNNQSYQNVYMGDDLTVYARHLFDGYTITQIVYQSKPEPIVWALRSDGKLLSLTYSENLQIAAWGYHHFGAGNLVENMCVLSGAVDTLYLIINRSGVRYIETLTLDTVTDLEDAFFVDSGIVMTADPAALTFDSDDYPDLAHLNTKSIAVLADGWARTETLQASTITFSVTISKVITGLPYTAKFEPLHQVIDRKTGSGQAISQKVGRAKIRFIKTVNGYLGPDEAGKIAIPTLKTDPTVPDSIYTGWREFYIDSTYTTNENFDESQLYYEQQSPYPAQIASMILDIE